jgi:hypothetical protein
MLEIKFCGKKEKKKFIHNIFSMMYICMFFPFKRCKLISRKQNLKVPYLIRFEWSFSKKIKTHDFLVFKIVHIIIINDLSSIY